MAVPTGVTPLSWPGWLGIALFGPSVAWAVITNLIVTTHLYSIRTKVPFLWKGMASTWVLVARPPVSNALRKLAVSTNIALIIAVVTALLLGPFMWNGS
jgi:hypothetical protein